MDKLIEALTLLRDSIDGVGRATAETAENPKWRYHRDTPHMKKMAGIYADWAAAVQVIIDNLPAISHAAGQEAVAWQYRVAKVLRKGWSEWQPCTENLYDEIVEFGEYGGRKAEARALFPAVARSEGEG